MEEIIQLKITLKWTKPPIWRRIQVHKKTSFFDLHNIIQVAMGWENYHLYEFEFTNHRIGDPNEEFEFFNTPKIIDASTITLEDVVSSPKEKIEYQYDFGDNWIHHIIVEKFLPRENSTKYPICTAGKLNCPPEDCGGVGGFYHLLETIADKKHPEYQEMIEWLGEEYDAEYFDKEEINKLLENENDFF